MLRLNPNDSFLLEPITENGVTDAPPEKDYPGWEFAALWSDRINRVVELILAILMALLILDVWLGVIDRYYFRWQLDWPEAFARYLMIWAALLAISAGIARRDHIGLMSFVGRLPMGIRRGLLIFADLVTLALFIYLFVTGIPFAAGGFGREAMIFGASMGPFFTAVPAAAFLASVQMFLTLLRDLGSHVDRPKREESLT